jgi:uncharacterized delta-60 repeat protein
MSEFLTFVFTTFVRRVFFCVTWSVIVLVFVVSSVFGLDGQVDTSYQANVLSPSYAAAVAVQSDGKILVGGAFAAVNGRASRSIVRLNLDGTVDTSFAPQLSGFVHSITIQPDGKIVVGGGSTVVNGQIRNGINRLNQDGSVDKIFNNGTGTSGGNNVVYATALQSDGKILIGGDFDSVNDFFRSGIARLNTDGSFDSSFTGYAVPPGFGGVYAIAVQQDHKIIAVGNFSEVNGGSRNMIVRYLQDGTVDQSFVVGVTSGINVKSVVIQPDNRILICGSFSQINGVTKNKVARLNPNGSLDGSFGTSIPFAINSTEKLAIQADGKILIVGFFNQVNETSKSNLARLNPDGSLDNTFTAISNGQVINVVPSDSPIIVGGFSQINSRDAFGVARLDNLGGYDETFRVGVGVNGVVRKLLPDQSGKTFVGGNFTHFGNTARTDIARLNVDGSLDQSFDPGTGAVGTVDTKVEDIAISSNSKIAVAGNFFSFNGTNQRAIVLLNENGTVDTSFNANLTQNDSITNVAFSADGKILIIGFFRFVGSSQSYSFARLNPDGTRDMSFQPVFSGGGVLAVAVQPNGKIIVGGAFTTVNGTSNSYIVRLNIDGTIDQTLSYVTPGYNRSSVSNIIIQPDGRLLITGFFQRLPLQYSFGYSLIRLNSDGSQDLTFNLPFLKELGSIFALQSDGRIIGYLNYRGNGNFTNRLAIRLRRNGSYDQSFDPNAFGVNVTGSIYTIAILPDNNILVGGQFSSYSNTGRLSLVGLENAMSLPPAIFDYDGDGRSDLSVRRPSDNIWYLLRGTAGYTAMEFGVPGDLIAPADYDGDGKTDVCVFRPSNGTWYTFNSQSQSFTTTGWGADGDLPVPADHDGDGKADLVVFRPSTNTWYTRFSLNNTFSTVGFGVAGDKPVVGDFDGDGKADIAVYRPSDGNWHILKTGFGYFVQTWGVAGDIPVPADYDGDGKTDVAVFRPSTGQWFRIQSTAGFDTVNWGANGDMPIPADYDGDGKSDVAVFRPSNVTWYIVGSTSGQLIQNYGVAGDVPTEGAFIY